MARQTITIKGTGDGGRVTTGDLQSLLAGQDGLVLDAPVRARTTLGGGGVKEVTIEVDR